MTLEKTLEYTTVFFGLACSILAAERLTALARHALWARLNGALAVERGQFSSAGRYRRAKYAAQTVKLVGGLGCIGFSSSGLPFRAVVLVVTAGTLVYDRRLEHAGGDGADQQLRIVGVTLAVTTLGGCVAPAAVGPGMIFLALQLLFCYGVAGTAKLATPAWRSGEALRCIVASDAFGHGLLRRWFGFHPAVAVALSWTVMLFEALFPLAMLTPATALAGLLLALGFHAGVAVTMRLNSFLLVFPVSYPAFYYGACRIDQLTSGRLHF